MQLKAAEQRLATQATDNKKYQEQLSGEIKALQVKLEAKEVLAWETQKKHANAINDLNKLHAERQKAYVEQIETLNAKHADELVKVRKLHKEDCSKRDETHAAEISEFKKDMAARIAEL